ncbi:hypothetical protein NUSPORA_00142 [Nucleospora cyclopteri]
MNVLKEVENEIAKLQKEVNICKDNSKKPLMSAKLDLLVRTKEILQCDDIDYYKILDVNENSTVDEIKKNYRALAYKMHPTKSKLPGSGEAMRKIQNAYTNLETQDKKTEYDRMKKYRNGNQNASQRFTHFYQNPFEQHVYTWNNSDFNRPQNFTFSFGNFEYFDQIYRHTNTYRNRRSQDAENTSVLKNAVLFLLLLLLIFLNN